MPDVSPLVQLCDPQLADPFSIHAGGFLKKLQEKMQEYIDNGAKLAWLIDRQNQRVEIYRPAQDVEVIPNLATLSGEDVLPGFVFNLAEIM